MNGAVGRLVGGLGWIARWSATVWIAWTAARVVVDVVGDESFGGAAREPVTWFVLAQLVVTARLLVVPPERRGGRRLVLVASLVALACGVLLHGRAPWAPWCVVLGVLGLASPGLLARPALRVATRVACVVGLLVAAGAGVIAGSGWVSYPLPAAPPAPAADRDGRWTQDLRYLGRELARLHGDAFHTQPRELYERRLEELVASVPARSDAELRIEVARFVAAVGDAHTECAPWWEEDDLQLPIAVHWYGDDLHVSLVTEDRLALAGRRVVAFDGTPVDEVADALRPLLAHENDAWFRYRSPILLTRSSVLATLGLLSDATSVPLLLEAADGSREAVVLDAVPARAGLAFTRVVTGAPLVARRPGNFWSAQLDDVLYVRYARCTWDLGLRAFTHDVLARLDADPGLRLVVDLRGNTGGTSFPFLWWFLPGVRERPALDRPDRLFVFVDRATFSSGIGIASAFAAQTSATLVGEPTGGKPDSWGEVRGFRLPNSGLGVSYSTVFHDDRHGGDVATLEPDVLATPTVEDAMAQRDPALEWVLAR